MRPINNIASHAQYPEPPAVTFGAKDLPTVQAALKISRAPTIDECLDLWLRSVRGQITANKPAVDLAVPLIRAQVNAIYKKAARPLLVEYGEHCSFCEARLPAIVEVEHRLPKSEYPDLAVKWQNFLLACRPCNNAKSAHPDLTELAQLVQNRASVMGTTPRVLASEQDYHDEIINYQYVWPNVDSEAYRNQPVELQYDAHSNGVWSTVARSAWDRTDTRIDTVDLLNHKVTAYLSQLGGTFPVQVIVVRPTASSGSLYTPTRAQDSIDLCQLNKHGPGNGVYDRRVIQRTEAWFEAIDALKALRSLTSQSAFDSVWQMVGANAHSKGFFSVWLTVFGNVVDPSGQRLQDRFVNEFTRQFPGTNPANLP
jgi:5-methylcytosine-specific restriction endonuclease McrA